MKRMILLLLLSQAICLNAQSVDTFSYHERLDLPYLSPEEMSDDKTQRLNLILPNGVKSPPLLLWIGGGAWSFVDRHNEMNLARKFAREGIAVASVGHRLSRGLFRDSTRAHGVQHPAHIQDIAAAFKWLYDHAAEYGYAADQIMVGGFSSGAYLAALLAMDERYLAHHHLTIGHIKAIIPVSGAYDINHYYGVFFNSDNPASRVMADTHVKDVFGTDETVFAEASPTSYMGHLKTPMLLISEWATFDYTQVFQEKIRASGFQNCQLFYALNFSHGGLWRDISNSPDSQTRRMMIDFIRRQALS